MTNKIIGDKVFTVAEIGINHNGSLEIAKALILLAKQTGFDAVKFQKRTVDTVYTKEELAAERKSPFGTTNGELKRHLEFGYEDYKEIDRYCKEVDIMWTASPWDIRSLEFIMQFDVPFIKIASASVTDMGLLKACCETGKPLFISTGMCDMPMIDKIVAAIATFGGNLECLYHCTSTYPTDPTEANLEAIKTLHKTYPNINIGYSGHEKGTFASCVAVVLGAKSVERHITLSEEMFGSDQKCSLDPKNMTNLMECISYTTILLGDGIIEVYPTEEPIAKKLRRVNTL